MAKLLLFREAADGFFRRYRQWRKAFAPRPQATPAAPPVPFVSKEQQQIRANWQKFGRWMLEQHRLNRLRKERERKDASPTT